MEIRIRQENHADHESVRFVIQAAFRDEAYSDQTEHLLVERLRKSPAFIPELSLVAEDAVGVVGHILLTRIGIRQAEKMYELLALAPVSVLPSHQKRGIGARLIRHAHRLANNLGFGAIALIGHAAYYPRFGYQPASLYNIRFPFDVPDANGMIVELVEDALHGINGMIEYPEAFHSAS